MISFHERTTFAAPLVRASATRSVQVPSASSPRCPVALKSTVPVTEQSEQPPGIGLLSLDAAPEGDTSTTSRSRKCGAARSIWIPTCSTKPTPAPISIVLVTAFVVTSGTVSCVLWVALTLASAGSSVQLPASVTAAAASTTPYPYWSLWR